MSAATPKWATGVEAVLPSNAAGLQDPAPSSVSCPSAGDCVAVGSYYEGYDSEHGLLLEEAAGGWSPGVEANLPSNADTTPYDPSVILSAVSCPSAGNCAAVGSYDSGGNPYGLLLSEVSGQWKATEASGPFGSGLLGGLGAVSCPSAGNCGAVGSYTGQGVLLNDVSGSWSNGAVASLPANGRSDLNFALNAVSCPSAGNCAATGWYRDTGGNYEGLLVSQASGVWHAGVEVVPPANARSVNPDFNSDVLGTISCPSAGNCVVVGSYFDGSSNKQGLLLGETSGTWGTGVEAALPADAEANPHVVLTSVSCASPGNCTAVGQYFDNAGGARGLLLNEVSGQWSRGITASLPADAQANPTDAYLSSVSCASAGNCAAIGEYVDTDGNWEGLLVNEVSGVWDPGVHAGLPAGAWPITSVTLTSVSCPSAGNCAAVGSFNNASGRSRPLLLNSSAAAPAAKTCVVPKVTGETVTAAKHALTTHNCRVGTIKHAFSKKVRKGRVISQKPKPRTRLKHGAKVNLVVSKGKKPR
jgi:hypothetical protein